jgi:hypothetical protein
MGVEVPSVVTVDLLKSEIDRAVSVLQKIKSLPLSDLDEDELRVLYPQIVAALVHIDYVPEGVGYFLSKRKIDSIIVKNNPG